MQALIYASLADANFSGLPYSESMLQILLNSSGVWSDCPTPMDALSDLGKQGSRQGNANKDNSTAKAVQERAQTLKNACPVLQDLQPL